MMPGEVGRTCCMSTTATLHTETCPQFGVVRVGPYVSDHAQPYAPSPIMDAVRATMSAEFRRRDRDVAQRFCLGLVAALSVAGRVMVVGDPIRVLMPADRNPFPRFRPFRWLP